MLYCLLERGSSFIIMKTTEPRLRILQTGWKSEYGPNHFHDLNSSLKYRTELPNGILLSVGYNTYDACTSHLKCHLKIAAIFASHQLDSRCHSVITLHLLGSCLIFLSQLGSRSLPIIPTSHTSACLSCFPFFSTFFLLWCSGPCRKTKAVHRAAARGTEQGFHSCHRKRSEIGRGCIVVTARDITPPSSVPALLLCSIQGPAV